MWLYCLHEVILANSAELSALLNLFHAKLLCLRKLFSSFCNAYYSGEIVTAMYDNFVAYRSKLFRPESPLAPNKNLSNTVSLIQSPCIMTYIVLFQ